MAETTYNPEEETRGTSPRPCQHCGANGHEHKKKRADFSGGKKQYKLVCPE